MDVKSGGTFFVKSGIDGFKTRGFEGCESGLEVEANCGCKIGFVVEGAPIGEFD